MPLPSDPIASQFTLQSLPFAQSQSGISQAAVALKLMVTAAASVSLNITSIPALFAGSIVAIAPVLTANKTAGSMTFTPTINGTAITTPIGLVNVALPNAALKVTKVVDAQQVG